VVFIGLGFHFRITGRGMLHCQRCGGDRPYRACAGRRWLHVMFVPLVPLDKITEHVQCTACDTRYRMEVLGLPTSAEMRKVLPAATRAAAAAMLYAGSADNGLARASAIETVREAGEGTYGEPELTADLAAWDDLAASADLAVQMASLSRQLAMPAHEWFLAGIVRVGLADGQLSLDERGAARQIAAYLGMTPAQAHGVIWMTEESAAAG
jgi:uncharacterized tellurite resistance protein B-like protein